MIHPAITLCYTKIHAYELLYRHVLADKAKIVAL